MKKAAVALILVIASIALVACGGSSSSSGSEKSETGSAAEGGAGGAEGKSAGSASSLEVETDPNGNLAYTTTEATAKAGKVTVDFTNSQSLQHDVAIENSNGEEVGKTELIAEGSDSTVVNLKPGTYTFFCTVPGHRQAGMEGKLVVK